MAASKTKTLERPYGVTHFENMSHTHHIQHFVQLQTANLTGAK